LESRSRSSRFARAPRKSAALAWLILLACSEPAPQTPAPSETERVIPDLYAVSVLDDTRAVAVGFDGIVRFSSDGGATWQTGRSGVRETLFGVWMSPQGEGWAVGRSGLILRSDDGGRSWRRQLPPTDAPGADLMAVSAIDGQRAIAVGGGGTRLVTTDGGASWRAPAAPPLASGPRSPEDALESFGREPLDGLNDVVCAGGSSPRCWLIGAGRLEWTGDGGQSWSSASLEGLPRIESIGIAEGQVELAAAELKRLRRIARALGAGEDWRVAVEAVVSRGELERLGRVGDPAALFELIDARAQEVSTLLEEAGTAPSRVELHGQPPWDYEDLLDDDPDLLVRYWRAREASDPGVRLRIDWRPLLLAVAFRDGREGIAVGRGGVVLRSDDAGRRWRAGDLSGDDPLVAVATTAGRAIALDEGGRVWVSQDGGGRWQPPAEGQIPARAGVLYDVAFAPDGRIGFMVGREGRILRTQDGGEHWQIVAPRPL